MLRSTSLYSYDEGQQYSEFRSIWNKCIISPFSLYKFLKNLAQIKWYCLCRLLLNYNRKGGERSSGLKLKTSFDFTKMISCSWENKYEKYCHFGFSWYSCAILSTLTYFMPLVTAWKVSSIRTEYGDLPHKLRIQPKYRKIRTRNNSVFRHFSRSGSLSIPHQSIKKPEGLWYFQGV